jgi:hypothetical protein
VNRRFFSISIVFSLYFFIFVTLLSAQTSPDQALFQAIAEGTLDQVQAAISGGANINATNQLGWTVLHMAVRLQRGDVATLLVQNKANINARDTSGQTPLYLAVESGQRNAVEFLIQNGADVNITDNNGENALSIAQKIGLTTISNFLVQHNASMPTGVNTGTVVNRNGRGMPQGMNNLQGENGMNPDFANPDRPVNIDMPAIRPSTFTNDLNLDPNEVKDRLQKYEGLEKAVGEVADDSRLEMNQWRKTEDDNRTALNLAVRRQYEAEIDFIKKIADEEKAQKTSESAEQIQKTRRERFLKINREVRDQIDQQERQTSRTTTSTNSRRGGSRTTTTPRTTRSSNRRSTNTTVETQPNAQAQENKYDTETQNEVDTWLNANVENLSGRISLMNTINSMVISDITSIKQVATEEKAEKTLAAIDGLLVARQQRFDELQKELEKDLQDQQDSTMQPIPGIQEGMLNTGDPMNMAETPFQNMPAGRGTTGGRRGR